MDRVISWPIDRDHLLLLTMPEALHRAVMTHLPDMAGRSTSIRKDTGTQFRVDLPTDPLGQEGTITVRLRGDAIDGSVGRPVDASPPEDGADIVVQVAAERRNTDEGRIRVRPVADHEAEDWARALLERHGYAVQQIAVSSRRRLGPRGSLGFWVRDVQARVEVGDRDLAQRAYLAGVGRGRAYGLGMVVALPVQQSLDQETPDPSAQGEQR